MNLLIFDLKLNLFVTFSIMERIQALLSGPLFFQLTLFAGFIAFTLLSFDQGIHDLSFEIVPSINCMSCQMLVNYIFSTHANKLSLCSSGIADIAYESFWYTMSINQQKLILFTIQRAQVPYFLHGYNMFRCSMQTFQEVRWFFNQFSTFSNIRRN